MLGRLKYSLQRLFGHRAVPVAPPVESPTPPQSQPAAKPVVEIKGPEWTELVQVLLSGRAPVGMRIEGSLSLAGLRIRSLPAGLFAKGDLDLRQCQRLLRIGDGTVVQGNLRIGGPVREELDYYHREGIKRFGPSRESQIPMRALPEGLRVGGDLHLTHCWLLETLPAMLSVERGLHLHGCSSLQKVPEQLTVYGDLSIVGAGKLKRLPDNLTVHGDLHLAGVAIEELPRGLKLKGSLRLANCPALRSPPEGFYVAGDLTMEGCRIESLSRDLIVGGNLRLIKMLRLREIQGGLRLKSGSLTCKHCPALERIGSGLEVGANVILRGCVKLKELPERLQIPGRLCLQNCSSLEELPAGLVVGPIFPPPSRELALDLRGCKALSALPEDMTIRGNVDVGGSGVRTVSKRLARQCRLLWQGVQIQPEILAPETLTPERILNEPNAEIRRTMMERVGLQKLLADAGADLVDEDTDAGGPRKLFRLPGSWGKAVMVFLHCRCPSSGREYLLRVPPTTSKCHAAAAWLAGFDNPDHYKPVKET